MDSARSALEPGARGRAGRPYDRSGDAAILECALELLAERDYERVTLDEVAARTGRAKTTLYRRWATKEELVLAAVRSAGRPPEAERLPDTGSLRSDLLAVVDSPWLGGPARRLAIFARLSSMPAGSTRLAEVVRSEVTEPYVDVYRRLLLRAQEKGEIGRAAPQTIALLAEVIPAMSSHRLSMSGAPVDRDFFLSVIDDVMLPVVHIHRARDGRGPSPR
jgi:AcrR family transcriptional regulator